jgi:ABC-type Fe3+/spermidine/putrescine transport system ATPase subunit
MNGNEPSSRAGLVLDRLCFAYGSKATVTEVSLQIAQGSLFALLGCSGSGKSTLLKLIAGHLQPSAGTISLFDRDLTHVPPERRNIGMVYQSYALFPHLDVRCNVAFGLQMRRLAKAEVSRRVEAMLDAVGLPAETRSRKPVALSGGQQQRVALARALVIEPDLLLLDEPLANLDRRLREQVREEIRRLQRQHGITTLLVTHDPEEAMSCADRVGVMAEGRLLQSGTPQELYERPNSPAIAQLLGDVNLAAGASIGDEWMIRPERLVISDQGQRMRIVSMSYRGSVLRLVLADQGREWIADVPANGGYRVDQEVGVSIPAEAVHHFSSAAREQG